MIRAIVPLLGLLSSAPALAQDEQYRLFKLSDGRDFVAIIQATEAAGFKVQVPQGEMSVSFAQLFDMVPVTKAEYDAQPPWLVYLAVPPERQKGITATFEAIPQVHVYGSKAPSGERITLEQEAAAAACDGEINCIASALSASAWLWIVTAHQEGADLVFSAQTNTGTTRANPTRAGMLSPDEVADAPYTVLEIGRGRVLVADVGGQVVKLAPSLVPPKPPDPDRDKAAKMIWIPVPGIPSLVRGDTKGFGLSLATALPASALWVGAVGQNTQSPAGTALLGLGGYYAITVAVNQAIGLRALPQTSSVGFGRTPGGGAAVTITVAQ